MSLPPLQCPLVVLLPLSETSPLSFQGSQAVREAAGRGHMLPLSAQGQPNPPGHRPALRPGNSLPLFVPAFKYWSFIPFFPLPTLPGISAVPWARLARGEQPVSGHTHFPRLRVAIFIPLAAFDSWGMKPPLKKGVTGLLSLAQDSCAGLPCPLGWLRRAGLPPPCCQGHPSFAQPQRVPALVGSATTRAGPWSPPAQRDPCASSYLSPGKAQLQRARALARRSNGHSMFLHTSFCFRWGFF